MPRSSKLGKTTKVLCGSSCLPRLRGMRLWWLRLWSTRSWESEPKSVFQLSGTKRRLTNCSYSKFSRPTHFCWKTGRFQLQRGHSRLIGTMITCLWIWWREVWRKYSKLLCSWMLRHLRPRILSFTVKLNLKRPSSRLVSCVITRSFKWLIRMADPRLKRSIVLKTSTKLLDCMASWVQRGPVTSSKTWILAL